MTSVRFGPVIRAVGPVVVLTLASVAVLAGPGPGWHGTTLTLGPARLYVLPQSAFNITDHNLTYSTNGFFLDAVATGSYAVAVTNDLVSNGRLPPDRTEAQIGVGPVPAGPEETNITPLLIIQEAGSGLLRIEYVPFPMNDTYGYLVFDAVVVASGPSPFAGHVLGLQYRAIAPPVPPYRLSQPYGLVTGYLSVSWDGAPLTNPFGLAWSSFGAFYAYGLATDGFGHGSVFANVSVGPAAPG